MNFGLSKELFKKHYAILFYLLFAALIITAISQKSYIYIDDYFAYSLANTEHSNAPAFTNYIIPRNIVADNVKYEPARVFYTKLVSVAKGKSFDYKNLARNLQFELSPPLHYALLFTICSFFPERYSKWFAGIINLLFSVLLLFVARKLARLLTEDKAIVNAISLIIVCSSSFLNANAYFRPYIMAVFCVTFETYAICRQVSKDLNFKSSFLIFAATLIGTLTHYYCALYSVIISAIFALYLVKDRKWKELIMFSLTQAFAGVVAYFIFPPIVYNVLRFGLNGTAGVLGISYPDVASYTELLLYYIGLVNEQWFGGILPVILLIMLFFAARKANRNAIALKEENITASRRYCLIFISAVVYCILVSARNLRIKWNYISMDFRYWSPVWIVLVCACFAYFLTNMKEYMSQRKEFAKYTNVLQSVLVIAVILGTFHYTDWNGRNLYRAYNTYEYVRKPYYKADCIVLTGDTISSYTAFEMSGYKSLTWLKLAKTTPARLQQLATDNKLVICVEALDAQADEIMMQVMKVLPEFKISVKLPMFANLPDFERPGNIYYLDRGVR